MNRWSGGIMMLAMLTIAACSEDAIVPPDPEPGTFTATVSGEFTEETGGEAAFGLYSEEGFRLTMAADDPAPHTVDIGYRPESRPGVGTYLIGEPAPPQLGFTALYTRQTDGAVVAFTSRSGELTITESSRARLEGTFTFRATAIMPGETAEREVLVEGSFSAPCATQFCGS